MKYATRLTRILLCFGFFLLPAHAHALRIITSFYPLYITCRNITTGIPGVIVQNLTPATTGCLHDYTLTTADMRTLANADILVINGAGMESFMPDIAQRYPGLIIINANENIPLLHGNPHIWVSISGAIEEVRIITAGLAAADAQHAAQYRANSAAYIAQLETLRITMHARLDAYAGASIVTFHEAFPYFAQEFNLHIAAHIEREPGSSPTPRELARTIDAIKKLSLTALFAEPQYPGTAALIISRETGLPLYQLDPAVTGPDSLNAYIAIMEKNLQVLENALRPYRQLSAAPKNCCGTTKK